MFKSISNMLSLSLQGTLFQSRHRHKPSSTYDLLMCAVERDPQPPYVLVAKETIIKNDLISKLQKTDNRLHMGNGESKRARARWCPDHYEQNYGGPSQGALNPQIEVYTRMLGLSCTRELNYGE